MAGSGLALNSPFDVWDISSWVVMSQEARGLDPKDWVVPAEEAGQPGQAHWWLFKPIKRASYRRYDDCAEKLAAELAALLELPSARVELARGERERGIISANVIPQGWSMESGDTLLSEHEGYVSCAADDRPRNRIGHNLANIQAVLESCFGPPETGCSGWRAIEVFAGFLVFDAWVANTDRHAINWGVLTCEQDGRKALAASFDHGSSLASGTQDDRLQDKAVERFAARGYAGRFENGSRLPLTALAHQSVESVGGRAGLWLERLAALDPDAIDDVVARVPEMSEARRRFISSLLVVNQRRLTS